MTSPRLLIAGGCALAFGASFANTGLVLRSGTSVSHLTGDIAKLTIDLAKWSPDVFPDVFQVGVAACCFFLGALAAGVLIHHPALDVSRPYGRSLSGIGTLLFLASIVMGGHPILGIGLAALGCGFQNALASHYRGLILRTTHLTGMFTDFGISLGMRLRGYDVPNWKIAVPALMICSFFIGGFSGALLHLVGFDTVAIAGVGYFTAGLGMTFVKHVLLKR